VPIIKEQFILPPFEAILKLIVTMCPSLSR
jgi:hypothetical protein